jgi:DNA-binding NarL/FixJ family response regulator
MRGRVLFVSDHPEVAVAVGAALRTKAFDVQRAVNKADAAARLESSDYDVFIIDINLADDKGGLAFLRHLKTSAEHLLPRVVVISTDAPEHISRELLSIGICDIVPKPVRAEEILQAVEECIDKSSARIH